MIQLLWKTVQQFLKKVIKDHLLQNPAIPPQGIHTKELKQVLKYMYRHVDCSTVHNSQKVGINTNAHQRKNGQRECEQPCNGTLLSHNRNEKGHMLPWVNLKNITPSEISQSQKVRHFMIIYVEYLEWVNPRDKNADL